MDDKPFKLNPKKSGPGGKKGLKNIGFIALVILTGLIIFAAYGQPSKLKEVPLSEVVKSANAGEVQKITVKGNELEVTKKGENTASLQSRKDPSSSIYEQGLTNKEVEIEVKSESNAGATWTNIGISLLPVLIIGALLFFMLRSAQGQGNQALSFGKSRARLYGNEKKRATFADIAGSDEAKQDLQEVVEFLKKPQKV